jgi:hypothetical protein
MSKRSLLISACASVVMLSVASAADTSSDPSGLWKKFPAIYKIHSGSVADRTPPTSTDRMLTVLIDGKAAKEVFDSIGPDILDMCSDEKGNRTRAKRGLYCSYDAKLNDPKDTPYRCWIGVNLRTGNTEQTISC